MLRCPPRRSRPNNKKPSSSRYKKSERKEEKRSSETRFTAVNNCVLRSRHPHVARASASLQTACAMAKALRQPDDERRQKTNGLICSSNTAPAFVLWMN